MLIRNVTDCPEIINRDRTIIRELLPVIKADFNLHYSLAHAIIRPGQSSLPHRLTSSEVYYILEGNGIMHIDDEQAEVRPGQAIYIPPNARQHIANTSACDLKFLCIVAPPWRADDEEIL